MKKLIIKKKISIKYDLKKYKFFRRNQFKFIKEFISKGYYY